MSRTADDADPDLGLDRWEAHLCAPLTGRKVICAFEVLASMTGQVAQLHRWDAQRPLLVADGVGTGPLPLETDADIVMLPESEADSLTALVRTRIDLAARLTPDVIARVEEYDPDGEAWWWTSPVGPNEPLLGRPVLGGRPTTQIRLEDKLALDDVLTAAGVRHRPGVVSAASYDALLAASDAVRVAASDAVVWAGDARDGINGGGDYVRVVADDAQAAEAVDFFAARCDRVRVSAFLDGVPCSIHAIVLPDGVMTLRPVELVSLRDPATGRFFYGGMGTTWDPPDADTVAMRSVATAVAGHLRDSYGLRGGMGVDGVLTADGFQVTEVNPRFSGGLTRLGRAAPSLHLDLVQLNAMLGRDVGRSAADLEVEALELLDENRVADCMGMSATLRTETTTHVGVMLGETGLEVADDSTEDVDATIYRGASSIGTFVRLTTDGSLVDRGERCAPLALAALAFADRHWGTGFGDLRMAPDLRPSPPGR